MSKFRKQTGVSAVGVVISLLLLLVLILGIWYFVGPTREVRISKEDLERSSEEVAENMNRAVDTVQEKSRNAVITAKVKTALALSKTVSSLALDVDSDDGRVTLTGTVPTKEAERTAIRIAGDTNGVVEVIDRIDVDPTKDSGEIDGNLSARLSDAELKATIYETLLEAEDLEVRHIRVLVDDGMVTLIGHTPSEQQRALAEKVVTGIRGVRSLEDHLKVEAFSSAEAPAPDRRG